MSPLYPLHPPSPHPVLLSLSPPQQVRGRRKRGRRGPCRERLSSRLGVRADLTDRRADKQTDELTGRKWFDRQRPHSPLAMSFQRDVVTLQVELASSFFCL